MSLDGFLFQSWQWLLLVPILWGALANRFHSRVKSYFNNGPPSIADLDLTASNRFYHPFVTKFVNASVLKPAVFKPFWRQKKFWLYGFIFTLFFTALAEPVLIGERLPDLPPERDIIFLVDVSVSMQLADYQQKGKAIKRIEVLRNMLNEFSSKMRGEKISVILFAEKAYVLVPLTNDQNLIHRMLNRISTTLAGRFTAVGDALLMALNESITINTRIEKFPENTKKRHQTFILFTDADSSRGKVSANAAATIISEHDIPVFTIAIGSNSSDGNENIKGDLYQPVNLDLLENIAQRTNAQSYQVDNAQAMQKALADILKQRKNIAIPKPKYETRKLYIFPLFLGLLLLVLFQITQLHKTGIKGGGVL